MAFAYPIMLDVTTRPVVIIGGGAVARRKAAGLIDAGATRVRVVSPTFHPDLPAGVERVADRYRPEHLDGASLVFAATSDTAVNEQIVRDAGVRGVLVNRADVEETAAGDFSTLATHRAGEIILTVSAGGNAALAAALRDRIAGAVPTSWSALVTQMRSIRPRIVQDARLSPDQRAAIFRAVACDDAAHAAVAGGEAGVWNWIVARFPQVES